ncbi:hypothetical protein [Staphylococcus equorum]
MTTLYKISLLSTLGVIAWKLYEIEINTQKPGIKLTSKGLTTTIGTHLMR